MVHTDRLLASPGRSSRLGLFVLCAALTLGSASQAFADDSSRRPTPRLAARVVHDDPRQLALDDLHKQLAAITSGSTLKRGTTAVYVVDANTGDELYEAHADTPLNPASNVKLVSTATVLSTLGPDWRYQTRILAAQPDSEGIVQGGIYLYGNSDPTLSPSALSELAAKLHAQGVSGIAGDIVLSDVPLRDTLGTSSFRISVVGAAPGKAPSVEVWPNSELVKLESVKVRSNKRGRSRVSLSTTREDLEGQPSVLKLQLRGTIRTGNKRVLYARLPDRALFTGAALKAALVEEGIAVTGSVHVQSFDEFNQEASRAGRLPFPLATHRSATIASIVARVNKRSLNSLSDRLVMTAAQSVYGGELSMDSAVTLMKQWLSSIGVDADSVVLDSGSGLSYRTKLTTRQIVKVLRAAGGYQAQALTPQALASFRDSLAIGGTDGTLRSRFRTQGHTLVGEVHGKTGTLTSVIALSGFLSSVDGRTLCFSIVTNGHRNRRKQNVRLSHEIVVAKLDHWLDSTRAVEPTQAVPAASDDHSDKAAVSQLPTGSWPIESRVLDPGGAPRRALFAPVHHFTPEWR